MPTVATFWSFEADWELVEPEHDVVADAWHRRREHHELLERLSAAQRGNRITLRGMAERRLFGLAPHDSDPEIIATLAALLTRGLLRLIEHPRRLAAAWPQRPTVFDEPSVPLRSLAVDPKDRPYETGFVAFILVDEDGVPLFAHHDCEIDVEHREGRYSGAVVDYRPVRRNARVSLRMDDVRWPEATKDVVAGAGTSSAAAEGSDVSPPEAPPEGPVGGDTVEPLRPNDEVDPDAHATVFTLPSYELDLEVFRPGWLGYDAQRNEGYSGIGCLVQVLDYARRHPERWVMVAGHTDKSGSKSHNREVGLRRAHNLATLLRADLEGWLASCAECGEVTDLAAHVDWAASRFGWPCAVATSSRTKPDLGGALAQWRSHAAELTGMHRDADVAIGDDDWRIAYALIDLVLAEELDLELPELASLRASLRWCEPAALGAGEVWPREVPGFSGSAKLRRRTEVLFASRHTLERGAGEPVGATLYGGDPEWRLDHVDPPLRVALQLGLRTTAGQAIGGAAYKIVSANGVVRRGVLGTGDTTDVQDVEHGPFEIYWTDPDGVVTEALRLRCEQAIAARDGAALLDVVGRGQALFEAVAAAWDEHLGGGKDALAQAIREVLQGSDDAWLGELLLDEAGFPGDHRFVELSADGSYLGGGVTKQGARGAR